jgi:hypothetical protein
MQRREILQWACALVPLAPWHAFSATTAAEMQVFKSRACGCCAAWVGHLREAGFSVSVVDVHSAAVERKRLGMPDRYGSCHTATVDGYVVEGHVPAGDIKRLLGLRPRALGLAVPGMPASAPGMQVPGRHDPYHVLLVDAMGQSRVFASHLG